MKINAKDTNEIWPPFFMPWVWKSLLGISLLGLALLLTA